MDSAFKEPPFSQIAFLGLGLMGGSMAKALKKTYGIRVQLSAYDPSEKPVAGVQMYPSASRAVLGASLVVLASPLGTFEALLAEIKEALAPGATLLDLGSVKVPLSSWMKTHLPERGGQSWYGGHPMCGSERSGAGASDPALYRGAKFFLTEGSGGTALLKRQLEVLVEDIGAKPCWVDPAVHDEAVAVTSHLPHLSAAVLMHSLCLSRSLSSTAEQEALFQFAAGGFRDVTRVAAGNEQVWRDILLTNKAELLRAIRHFEGALGTAKHLLEQGDADGLEAYLKQARHLRSSLDN